jgi:predicted transcriptional regulator
MNLSLRIEDSLRARLDKAAKDLDRPLSWIGVEALEQYLSHHEWFVTSVERAIAAADNGGPFVSHDEVMAKSKARIESYRK